MRNILPPTPGARVFGRLLSPVLLGAMPPPPPMPTPFPPPTPPQQNRTRDFFIGLGVGAIPLLLAMVGVGGLINISRAGGDASFFGRLLATGGFLYLAAIIVMIGFLAIARLRRVGFGMLAAVAASPVVFFIGCMALIQASFASPGGTTT